ncbi:sensor histidine kinase [Streptomyces sp. NPDC002835]
MNQIVVSADGRQTVAAVASHGQESAAGHRFEQLAHHSEGEFLLQGTASRPYDRQAADAFPPSAQQLEVQPLRPIIERAVLATGKEVHVLGVSDVLVRTDRRRLERVLVNLIANAYKHGTPPVTVAIEGPVVTVRDHGPGYPDHLLEAVPAAVPDQGYGHTGGRAGHGLGLTIAQGQARTLGAVLELANAVDGEVPLRSRCPKPRRRRTGRCPRRTPGALSSRHLIWLPG